ncbi:hypothetical protein [Pseudomonas costantinii]|nr:hypothetical protein [Pseudomonas costantinii]
MSAANKQLHAQSGYSAFSACRQMLTDILFINGGCYTGKLTQDELQHSRDNWEQDRTACDEQIANPSAISPEDQSEAEWEAEQRKAGTSESDIELMRTIRRS